MAWFGTNVSVGVFKYHYIPRTIWIIDRITFVYT